MSIESSDRLSVDDITIRDGDLKLALANSTPSPSSPFPRLSNMLFPQQNRKQRQLISDLRQWPWSGVQHVLRLSESK